MLCATTLPSRLVAASSREEVEKRIMSVGVDVELEVEVGIVKGKRGTSGSFDFKRVVVAVESTSYSKPTMGQVQAENDTFRLPEADDCVYPWLPDLTSRGAELN